MRRIVLLSAVLIITTAVVGAILPASGSGRAQAADAALHAARPRSLVVIKRYGAAIRVSPSSSAAIVSTLPCGTNMRVLGQSGGWYHVQTGGPRFNGWVGGARVGDAANPPSYDCTDAYTFQVGQHAYSYVKTGCLSLRVTPSRSAVYNHCVSNFHDYRVWNGPIEVNGEDWFGVTSPSTGSGWSLAQYLLPYRS